MTFAIKTTFAEQAKNYLPVPITPDYHPNVHMNNHQGEKGSQQTGGEVT